MSDDAIAPALTPDESEMTITLDYFDAFVAGIRELIVGGACVTLLEANIGVHDESTGDINHLHPNGTGTFRIEITGGAHDTAP